MLTAELFKNARDISIKKEGKRLGLEDLKEMSTADLRQCEILLRSKKLAIFPDPGYGDSYKCGLILFKLKGKLDYKAEDVISTAYQLALIQEESHQGVK